MRSLALEAIAYRNKFYYHNYRQMLVVLGLMLLIIAELSAFLYLKMARRAEPVYFPTTSDGRAVHPVPLDRKLLSDEEVRTWAIEIAENIYELDFVNYARSLEDLRNAFTDKGYDDYLNALKQSNNLEAVKAKMQVVSAELDGEPGPLSQGDYKGRCAWRIKVPLKVRYQNANNELLTQRVRAALLIVRMDVLEVPKGIAIHQYIEEPV